MEWRLPQAKLVELVRLYKQSCEVASEVLAAVVYMLTEDKQDNKKVSLSKKYVVDKWVRFLGAGGHTSSVGAHIGKFLQLLEDGQGQAFEQPEYVKVGDVFKSGLVNCMGKASEAQPGTWAHFMGHARTTFGENLQAKVTDVAKVLKKRGWKSAMSRVENFVGEGLAKQYPFEEESIEFAIDDGASFWVVGLKANAFRFGADQLPLPGLAMNVMPIDQELIITSYRIEGLLSQGILINDLPGFLDSPSASDFLGEFSVVVKAAPGEVIHIPTGHIPSILYAAGTREQETQVPYGYYLAYTVWSAREAAALDSPTWSAIHTFNQKYLDSVSQSRHFMSRAALLGRFNKQVLNFPTS